MEGICEALADELKEVQQIHLKIQLKKRKQQQQGRHQPKANQVHLHNMYMKHIKSTSHFLGHLLFLHYM